MIRFAYPNIDENNQFTGCGRYLATSADDSELGKGYELADPNVGHLSQITTAASMLAPESFDTEQNVYEHRDDPSSPYLGDSMGLAYLFALIKRSRMTKWEKAGVSSDIWCTGAVDIVGEYPFLKNVFQNLFDIKLRAFLESGDSLFILPVANLKPAHNNILFEEKHVSVLSLSRFRECSPEELFGRKTVLKVHGHELEELVSLVFDSPEIFELRDSHNKLDIEELKYYIYLSETKINMLYPQISDFGDGRSKSSFIKAKIIENYLGAALLG